MNRSILLLICHVLASLPAYAQSQPDPGLPKGYWDQPLSAQGRAPAKWPDIEASLDPMACADCHQEKFEEWRGSLHARAFPPGLIGQLLTYSKEETLYP